MPHTSKSSGVIDPARIRGGRRGGLLGEGYLFFLKLTKSGQFFELLAGYAFSEGVVVPIDKRPELDFAGIDEQAFLNLVASSQWPIKNQFPVLRSRQLLREREGLKRG